MGVETGLILAASLAVIAAFAAPWVWPAIDRSGARPEPASEVEPEEHPDSAPFEISRDEVVVRLRDRGLTYGQIAERLSGDFGQRMSPSTARRIWLRAHHERRPPPAARAHGSGARRVRV
jgi:hypothetical protein